MSKNIKPYIPHIIFVFIFIGTITLIYFFVPNIDSNLYLAVVTFLVGLSAFYLYTKQQEDTKREIANIIVSEIRFAEARISAYRKGIQISFFLEPILPNNTWAKNNHLYINDLDPIDEYPLVRDFYNKCVLFDRALVLISSASQLEQKADAMYRGLSNIAEQLTRPINDDLSPELMKQMAQLYQQRTQLFIETFVKDGTTFNPDAPRTISVSLLQQINPIMNTPAGEKLKRIARIQ